MSLKSKVENAVRRGLADGGITGREGLFTVIVDLVMAEISPPRSSGLAQKLDDLACNLLPDLAEESGLEVSYDDAAGHLCDLLELCRTNITPSARPPFSSLQEMVETFGRNPRAIGDIAAFSTGETGRWSSKDPPASNVPLRPSTVADAKEVGVFPHKHGKSLRLMRGVYRINNRIALWCVDAATGEPSYKVTTNEPDTELAEGEIIVKNWGENSGADLAGWLIEHKLAKFTERNVRTDESFAPILHLLERKT
jgi:hypothetical protein